MTAINIVTLPGYYALYALYADYLLNNERHAALEDLERVRKSVRMLGPVLGLEQPFRKDWPLRLFTERESLASYPPELVDEAWRQLREAIDALGPPPGWRGPRPRERLSRRVFKPRPVLPPPAPARFPVYPRSPVDYRRAV